MGVLNYAKYLPVLTGGSDPYAALRVQLTAEWRCDEALATDDLADSIGSRTLTQIGNPAASGTYRTFAVGTSGSRRRTNDPVTPDDVLGVVNRLYTVSAWFRVAPVPAGPPRQICTIRLAGSGSGVMTFMLRANGTDLELYSGNGAGPFTNTNIRTGLVAGSLCYAAFTLRNLGTGAFRISNDGVLSDWTPGPANVTTARPGGTMYWTIGGETQEYYDDRIYRVRLYSGVSLSDAELALDYADPQGVA